MLENQYWISIPYYEQWEWDLRVLWVLSFPLSCYGIQDLTLRKVKEQTTFL